jgi:hypothetical protein
VHPLGAGLGSTTLAAGKLATGGEGIAAETDHGNLFISLGFIGGILYLVVTYLVFKQTLQLWNQTRNTTFLMIIGLLVTGFSQWLSGGLYSLCFLIWFNIGVIDKYYASQMEGEAPTKRKVRWGKSRTPNRALGRSRSTATSASFKRSHQR